MPEGLCMSIALYLRDKCNLAFGIFREVASGRDLKKFLYVMKKKKEKRNISPPLLLFVSPFFLQQYFAQRFLKIGIIMHREYWGYGLCLLLEAGLIS